MSRAKTNKKRLGQYFTSNEKLQTVVTGFIRNSPDRILEPSVGRGDLVLAVKQHIPHAKFDMYEIDQTVTLLNSIQRADVVWGDFLKQDIDTRYKTVVGNPPYVKKRSGNLYIDFIKKCHSLLEPDGEIVFIVPSDFFKLTSAAPLLNTMMTTGVFTDVYHPNDENLFQDAAIDVLVFRYVLSKCETPAWCMYNEQPLYIINNEGMITFSEKQRRGRAIKKYFDIYVGMVSGKEEVFKHTCGNIDVLNSENKRDKYIFLDELGELERETFNVQMEHLKQYKTELLARRIKHFTEDSWYEWGAPRNVTHIRKYWGEDCIYIHTLTRQTHPAFLGQVEYFGGGLIMLKPNKKLKRKIKKRGYSLARVVEYLNSDDFKSCFTCSGRFRVGHRQISNFQIEKKYLR